MASSLPDQREGTMLDFRLNPEQEALRERARVVAAEGVARYGLFNDCWINGFSTDFA
jgi:hypothetical protein